MSIHIFHSICCVDDSLKISSSSKRKKKKKFDFVATTFTPKCFPRAIQ
eukprot:UN10784